MWAKRAEFLTTFLLFSLFWILVAFKSYIKYESYIYIYLFISVNGKRDPCLLLLNLIPGHRGSDAMGLLRPVRKGPCCLH